MPMAISFNVFDRAIALVLVALIRYLAGSSTRDLANLLACELRDSIYTLRKQAHFANQSSLSCLLFCIHHGRMPNSSRGWAGVSKTCFNIKFPNHPLANCRGVLLLLLYSTQV